jgi:hypothetical protein
VRKQKRVEWAVYTSEHQTSAAFVGGVDLPIHAKRHFDIVPMVRLYRFNLDVSKSLVDHSSARFVVGAIARAKW